VLVAGLILVGVAALFHIYIFVLESLRWTAPGTRRAFGVRTEEEAEILKTMAFNQGFYNLFLAIMVIIGLILYLAAETVVGATLIFAGAGAMVLAAVVLVVSSPRLVGAALLQGLAPLQGIIFLAIGL